MDIKSLNLLTLIFTLLATFTLKAQTLADPNSLVKTAVTQYTDQQGHNFFAVTFKNQDEWHTYWINPGDAGNAIEATIEYNEQKTILINPVTPAPKKYIEGDNIVTFGHTHTYTYFYPIDDLINKLPNKFNLHLKWLACNQTCVPGERVHSVTKSEKTFSTDSNLFAIDSDLLDTHFELSPQIIKFPMNLDMTLSKHEQSDSLLLYFNLSDINLQNFDSNFALITPFNLVPLTFKSEKIFHDNKGNIFGEIAIDWDGMYQDPEMPFPTSGRFQEPLTFKFLLQDLINKRSVIIEKTFNTFLLTPPVNFSQLTEMLTPLNSASNKKEPTLDEKKQEQNQGLNGIWYYIVLAMIGGLILNIMPCVLPVISFKLFGLIKTRNKGQLEIIKHNFAYTAGVLACFMILATVVSLLKFTGESIGWGFQLQSPIFVALMIIALFFFAFNLFGLYEFPTIGGKKLGNIQLSETLQGDFLGGVFATILATPCSAPFLGTALTFAFTASTLEIFIIFFAIGIGLAAPFIVTAFIPKLLMILPKPGNWMELVKKFLALSVLITAIWLEEIFAELTSAGQLFSLNILVALLLFLLVIRKANRLVIYTMVLLNLIWLSSFILDFADTKNLDNTIISSRPSFESWSEENMNSAKQRGQHVFIDFTAKWCLTCKVNKMAVLDTEEFYQLAQEYDLQLLRADWTKRDPVIEKFLKKHNHVGVPVYFIQNSNGTLTDLGETISIDKIKKALE